MSCTFPLKTGSWSLRRCPGKRRRRARGEAVAEHNPPWRGGPRTSCPVFAVGSEEVRSKIQRARRPVSPQVRAGLALDACATALGPWVRVGVRFLQTFDGDVGVNLGGR